ncbi:deoxyribonuclease NucA/NucB [Actinomadura pelletieri DSM 43383]|uniref:Deoxyribonuclease NucA/NucB n=1 Tax=Actinomadura pelletieri DSM 43383 TaxID=1120940 RepID=A0A495QAD3_9ACTN|nr:hypothetical protein [Actinomadura pelletieri]RKS68291.1 deoxyribonuclease NucA/NucB [Actinomadura pelletieri DSM 43383]
MKFTMSLATAVACVTAVAAFAAPASASASDGDYAAYRTHFAKLANVQGGEAPTPSIAEMLARERTHTYGVDMSTVAQRDPRLPRAQSWRDECLKTKIEDTKVGEVKDRSHYCNHGRYFLSTLDTPDGKPGVVWFDWLVYGEGSVGGGSQRIIALHQELMNMRSDPDFPWPRHKVITASIGCDVQVPKGIDPNKACQGTWFATRTLSEWQSNPYANTKLWSDEKELADPKWEPQVGEEKVMMAAFQPKVTSIVPSLKPGPQAKVDPPPDIINTVSVNGYARFDSAKYLSTRQGAIFRGVVPHISYDPSKPRWKELAEHIRDACDKDGNKNTYPPTTQAKDIPGCDIDHLIHRVAQSKVGWPKPQPGANSRHKERYRANSNAKDRACNASTPQTSTPGAKQCDEFPFASTYEGAARSEFPTSEFAGLKGTGIGNQFSVRKINAQQNNWGGSDLSTWYSNDRILDWATGGSSSTSASGLMRDGFWVRIGSVD